jgi:hypothetical protein
MTAAEILLIATAVLYLAFRELWITFVGVAGVAVVLALFAWLTSTRRQTSTEGRTVGVGTVRCSDDSATGAAGNQVFIEVVAVSGETFIGKLVGGDGDLDVSVLRPGLVVLVAFDPAAREELSLPDDVLAVQASWVGAI